jgi:hypothetical protein
MVDMPRELADARLQATGMFQTTAIRRRAFDHPLRDLAPDLLVAARGTAPQGHHGQALVHAPASTPRGSTARLRRWWGEVPS